MQFNQRLFFITLSFVVFVICTPIFNYFHSIHFTGIFAKSTYEIITPDSSTYYFKMIQVPEWSPLSESGVKSGDIIVKVNGYSFTKENGYYRKYSSRYERFRNEIKLSEKMFSKPITVSILRNNSEKIISYSSKDRLDFLWELWKFVDFKFFVAFIIFLIGNILIILKPEDRNSLLFYFFSTLTFVFLQLSNFEFGDSIDVIKIRTITGNISLSLVSVIFLHFFLVFPERELLTKFRKRILFAAYSIWVILSSVYAWSHFFITPLISIIFAASTVFQLINEALAIIFLIYNLQTAKTSGKKQKLRVATAGVVFAVIPIIIFQIIPIFYPHGLITGQFPLLFLVFVYSGIAIAIFRHKIVDVRLVVKRSTQFSATLFLLTVIYLGVIVLISYIYSFGFNLEFHIINIISVFLLVMLLNPLKLKIQKFVETVFDRDRYDYKTSIMSFARTSTHIISLPDLLMALMNELHVVMKIKKVSVFIWSETQYLLSDFEGFSENELFQMGELHFDLGTRELFKGKEYILLDEYSESDNNLLVFRNLGAKLLIPLYNKRELLGFICLWDKLSERNYDDEDVQLLITLSSQFAITLDNAIVYSEIKKLNASLEGKVKQRTAELKDAQLQLIHSEKMNAMGTLVAGIAHEINNPLNMISASIHPLQRLISEMQERLNIYHQIVFEIETNSDAVKIFENIQKLNILQNEIEVSELSNEIGIFTRSIEKGTDQASKVIETLKNYLKINENIKSKINLNDTIETVINLTKVDWQDRITIEKQLNPIPPILGFEGQINQVIFSITQNAIQSIPDKGTITFMSYTDGDSVYVKIIDSGMGIKEDIQDKIFDPFFTTQKIGEGFGLGLSISYEIIKNHGGMISFVSGENLGTEFEIKLPAGKNEN